MHGISIRNGGNIVEKLRFGIMGTASIIDRFAGAVRLSDHGIVAAVASRSIEKAQKKAVKLEIEKYYGRYEDLVEDEEIDVIYIPTINHAHKENAVLALCSGKHILVEKPMTLSESDTRMLFALAKEKNLFIMEAQKSLFLPATNEVRNMIKDDIIGKIHFFDYMISIPEVGFEWFYDRKSGGGALLGSGNYILAHAMFLTDEDLHDPKGAATISEGGVDLQCLFSLKTDSGILVDGKITTLFQAESGLTIYGEKGRIILKDFWKARHAVLEIYGEPPREIHYPVEYEMVYEVNHVIECIVKDMTESPVMSRNLSVKSARLIDDLWRDF